MQRRHFMRAALLGAGLTLGLGALTVPSWMAPAAAPIVQEYTAPETLDDFEGRIARESDGKLAIVMYHATWCPHCQSLTKLYEDAAPLTAVPYMVLKLDVEKYPALAGAMKTQRGVPESHIYLNGKRLHYFIGDAPSAKGLARYLDQFADKIPAKPRSNAPIPQ